MCCLREGIILTEGDDIQESTDRNQTEIVLLILLAVTMVSSASPLIKLSQSPDIVKVFWRTLYGGLLMAGVGGLKGDWKKYQSPQVKMNWPWLFGIGIILSFHFTTWFTSLSLTTIAASVVLVNTSPMFTAIISMVFLGESIRRKTSSGIIVAMIGASILALNDIQSVMEGALYGDILALISAVFLSIYFLGGQKYAKGIPNSVYTSIVYLSAAFVTMIQCIIFQIDFLVFDISEMLIFLALALFPTALGHSVNNYLLTIVPAYVVSSAVLGEPIGATILGILVFGESQIPNALQLLGFATILIGIALVLADLAIKRKEVMPIP
jgi:drug/metabolite transporter (DMT)-like permease